MITASHNPPEFNGIKLFTESSLGYSQAQESKVERAYYDQSFRQGSGGALKQGGDMNERYLSFIKSKLPPAGFNHRLKVVVDPGNGAASKFVSDIFIQMGFDVLTLNDEPDGLFPGRSPEPKEDTLQGTVEFLRQHNADLAICFDGDADRVVFCDKEGFLGFNEPIAFVSRLAVKKTGRKKVATTVETGTLLDLAVKDLGAEVVRGRVGDVPVAYLAQQLDAALGVEQVGVYIMPEVGYYPDSIFASLFLLSHISDPGEIRQFFQGMPRLFFEKAKVSCPNELKEPVMARVKEQADIFSTEEANTLDGLRLQFDDSWMLIRPSGTEPIIRVIAESMSEKRTDELIRKGKKLVQSLVEADRRRLARVVAPPR
jgi:phosphoglucosamine mutase